MLSRALHALGIVAMGIAVGGLGGTTFMVWLLHKANLIAPETRVLARRYVIAGSALFVLGAVAVFWRAGGG